ncbi:ParM/StbA family protein [Chengkuizengella axinellae]|uniref:ParM/StbA family protein n=1 Tax=Chengkuizengella axinellae TaxID=3064388 RepID=A0ABT9J473_9BACL|nr:ParM/StbA family protein [Chengkuizengella sp. 2205SS18-9]MDP5275790.1 ParM/StbA family protein [Chengkuizengella sp. 2205SS18-9]
MSAIIGLDLGRSYVKAYTGSKIFHFPSIIGEWRDRRLLTDYGENAIECYFNDEKFFVGTLAQNESEFYRSMMTDNKSHTDARLLALISIHRAALSDNILVVTGLPVAQHNDTNKKKLQELLVGYWEIEVNGIERNFHISDVKVAVEGGAAFWSSPKDGLIRVVDGGSKTINYVTMINRRYVDRESGSLPFGFGTNKSGNNKELANRIAGEVSKKWGDLDEVWVVGGKARELTALLQPYFPNAKPMQNPLYANAIGYYRIGKTVES